MARCSSLTLALMIAIAPAFAQFGVSYPMYVEGPSMGELVDIDSDGDKDLLLGTRGGPVVYKNNDGIGNFQSPEAAFGVDHAVVHGVDMDSDGLVDVIGARQGQSTGIDVFRYSLLQNTHYLFGSISSSLSASDISSADFDLDNDQDLVFGLSNGQMAVAWNDDGQGNFGALEMLGNSGACSSLRTLDLDADGHSDIVWYNALDGTMNLIRGHAGGFDAPVVLGNDGPGELADLDSDGLPDLVCINSVGDLIWRQNLGGAGFGALQPVADCSSSPGMLETGDVDGDGDLDVIWSISQPYAVQWSENLGGGGFGPIQDVVFLQGATSDLVCGDLNGDSSIDLLQVGTSSNQVIWMAGVIVPGGRLVGRVFNDINGDGLFNGNEHGLQNRMVEVPGVAATWTNAAGLYWFDLSAGTYTVEVSESPLWTATTPVSQNVTVSMMGTTTGIDFGGQGNVAQPAIASTMTGTASVCSFLSSFWAMAENTGNQVGDLHLSVTLDPLVTFSGSEPQPDSVVAGVAHWTFEHVVPGQSRSVTIGALMPGVFNMGDTLHNVLDAGLHVGGSVVATSQALHEPVLLSSYDPNEKKVVPAGKGSAHFTAFGERMVYTIHFQNTGTYHAENVVLLDTLDADLDATSVQLLSASHPSHVELVNGVLRFVFDGIMLPDSATDPRGSQGFVRFAIDHLEGLPEGTVLSNTANIFFDLNPAIVTNTVFNTLTADLVGMEEAMVASGTDMRLVPNPAVEEVELRMMEAPGKAYQVFLHDAAGRAVRFWQVGAGVSRLRMPLGGVEQGAYVVRVRSMDGLDDRSVRLIVGN